MNKNFLCVAMFAISVMFNCQTAKTENGYNLISAKEITLSPYAYIGYSVAWGSYNNTESIPYQYALRNFKKGLTAGVGLVLNKYWKFGASVHKIGVNSTMRGGLMESMPEIEGIKTSLWIVGIDAGLKMPFSLFNGKMNFYAEAGLSSIFSEYKNSYSKEYEKIPVKYIQDCSKMSVGANVGVGVGYTILSFIELKATAKRMFILSSSPLKDFWLVDATVGINF